MGKNEVEKVCGVDRDHLEEGKGGNKGWGCRLPDPLPRPGNQTSSSEWGRQRTVSHSWGAEVGVGRAGSLTAWLRDWMNHTYRLTSWQMKWRSELQQSETSTSVLASPTNGWRCHVTRSHLGAVWPVNIPPSKSIHPEPATLLGERSEICLI